MIRSALIGVLVGMILGGGTIGALSVIVLQEQTAEIRIMAVDVHDLKRNFDMGGDMVLDGAKRADAMTQARANAIRSQTVRKSNPH